MTDYPKALAAAREAYVAAGKYPVGSFAHRAAADVCISALKVLIDALDAQSAIAEVINPDAHRPYCERSSMAERPNDSGDAGSNPAVRSTTHEE